MSFDWLPWWQGDTHSRRDLVTVLKSVLVGVGRRSVLHWNVAVDCLSGAAFTVVGRPGAAYVINYGRYGRCGERYMNEEVRYCARLSSVPWYVDVAGILDSFMEFGVLREWRVEGLGCISGTHAGMVCGAVFTLVYGSGSGCLVIGVEESGNFWSCASSTCGGVEVWGRMGYDEAIGAVLV